MPELVNLPPESTAYALHFVRNLQTRFAKLNNGVETSVSLSKDELVVSELLWIRVSRFPEIKCEVHTAMYSVGSVHRWG